MSGEVKVPMRRSLRILLVLSLALNLAVAGLAAGYMLKGSNGDRGPRSIEFASGGPLARALSREDRQAIGEILRSDPELRMPNRREREALVQEVVAILQAETFDRDALSALLQEWLGRVGRLQERAGEAVVERIAMMSDAERAAFADALLRPRRSGD